MCVTCIMQTAFVPQRLRLLWLLQLHAHLDGHVGDQTALCMKLSDVPQVLALTDSPEQEGATPECRGAPAAAVPCRLGSHQ